MSERVRRIGHVEPATERVGLSAADEKVPDQRLSRRRQFVGKNVPGSGLQPPRRNKLGNTHALLRSDAQIVLEQDRLPVEEKRWNAVFGFEEVEQVIHHRDEPRGERGGREVPLPVPVRVGNEMKDQYDGGSLAGNDCTDPSFTFRSLTGCADGPAAGPPASASGFSLPSRS